MIRLFAAKRQVQMRPFETMIIGLVCLAAVWRLRSAGHPGGRSPMERLLTGLYLAALLLHLIFEGARWQMGPVYLGLLLLLLPRTTIAVLRVWIVPGTVLLLGALSLVAAVVLPVFRFPRPTGPYATGTSMVYLRDSTRTNAPGVTGPAGGREFAVQLWYPAAPSHNRRAPYRTLAESTLHSSYMRVVRTRSRQDAPLAPAAVPFHVLLFNPAWDSRRGASTALIEELASHGYVVAAIEHPGRTGPFLLPDGRLIRVVNDPIVDHPERGIAELFEAAIAREVDVESTDDSFVLDQLAILNDDRNSPFFHRLDTDHAGVLGHSLGSAVAADACASDPRLRAAFGMTAVFFGKARTSGVAKPYLGISEPVPLATPEQMAHMDHTDRLWAETNLMDEPAKERLLRQNGGHLVVVQGINHSSFSDRAFYSPLRRISGEDNTPRERVLLIVRSYAVQFFDKTLKGQASPMLDSPPDSGAGSVIITHPYPEVTQWFYTAAAR